MRVIDGEPLPPPDRRWKSSERPQVSWPFVFFFFLFLGSILNRFFGRVIGSGIAALLGAGIVWWFTSVLMFAALSFVGFFLLGILFGGFRGFTGTDFGGRGG